MAIQKTGKAAPVKGGPVVVNVGGGAASHSGFRRVASGTGGANVVRQQARPYHPLFASPDRLQLPVQLAQQNQYWRLFYNVDPIIGGVLDMHSEMPWSSAYLNIDQMGDTSKEILHAYEDMLIETELLSWLPRITKEYLIIGEVFPHLHWDDSEGIFSHITLHNPDYVEVVSSPLVDDDPILTLRPSQDMRRILQSSDPRYIRLRSKMPSDVLALLMGGKNLPLDPLNASHLARRAFPYDIRGTSMLGRMFRILMFEDAVFNGQIQQAQRHALPLRVFKLGDPNSGWIPSPQNQEDFAQLLAEVEVDPLAAIIYSHALQVEYHGIEGKQLRITQEWDVIERAKLIALGVSKAFLHGEVSFASANAGLQVLMMRYRTLRDMFINDWIYKKVFSTMAELNGFYREMKKTDQDYGLDSRDPTERQSQYIKEAMNHIATLTDPKEKAYEMAKIQPLVDEVQANPYRRYIAMNKTAASYRSKVKKKKHLLYPNIQFEKRLDVRQDEAILQFWTSLAEKGWISPRTVVQGAGLDYDAEQATVGQDAAKIVKNQMLMQAATPQEGGGMGGMGGLAGGLAGGMGGAPGEGMPGAPGGAEGGPGLEPEGGPVPPGGAGGESGAAASVDRERIIKLATIPEPIQRELIELSTETAPDLFVGNG